ncbi:hypothetical protein [Membranihabitans marinus]|uniref:hypothetical protein n=1 Tax=Membranihabitans marinus TaxID=1227546 RepID=UPI001F319C2D|nr:hypothetical protein [Membranihabitans marinus]
MNPLNTIKINICFIFYFFCFAAIAACQKSELESNEVKKEGDPMVPRIDFVEMDIEQPHEDDTAVIWYDDFSTEKLYMEQRGGIDKNMKYGVSGGSADFGFNAGDVTGRGDRKVAFGDFPNSSNTVRSEESFDDIYWRIYVKHELGWRGAPAKVSRATSIVASDWSQAMILHLWSSGDRDNVSLDPASGVKGQADTIITKKYNDFDNLIWLGNMSSEFELTSTKESGYWIPVEVRAKLNTPGNSDGVMELWIDGRLEVVNTELNFRGSYIEHGINAVFLESYWNSGAIKKQGRWFDNFVISTQPIGPVVTSANPKLYKTPYGGAGELSEWVVELASDSEGEDIVFQSEELGIIEKVEINTNSGSFVGSLTGKSSLELGQIYYVRVRQSNTYGNWSEWSRWHQPFKVKG